MTADEKISTPTASCASEHLHVSAYEAMRCERNAPEVPTSYDVPQGWSAASPRR